MVAARTEAGAEVVLEVAERSRRCRWPGLGFYGMDEEQRRARLAVCHHLTPSTRHDDLAALADDLVAFHSTDPVTAYLSACVRMEHPSLEAVRRAIYDDRRLIRHHAMRRTLWLATPEVTRQMHAAATRKLVAPERKRLLDLLASADIADPERWLDEARTQTLDHLHAHGPTAARDLGRDVPALRQPLIMAAGTPWEQRVSAHTRVLLLLGFEGAIVRAQPLGSWVSGAYRYAAADDWLPGGMGDCDLRAAAEALTRRWLRTFGPATTDDLRWWMGWTLTLTRRALTDARARPIELGGGTGWLAEDDPGHTAEPTPWVALLPSLDPATMGWKQREWYLPEAAADAFDTRGNAGPTIWVDGRVVGAWAQTKDGRLHQHYFEQVAAARRCEVDQRAAELRCWVGDTRYTVRFPGDVHARLME